VSLRSASIESSRKRWGSKTPPILHTSSLHDNLCSFVVQSSWWFTLLRDLCVSVVAFFFSSSFRLHPSPGPRPSPGRRRASRVPRGTPTSVVPDTAVSTSLRAGPEARPTETGQEPGREPPSVPPLTGGGQEGVPGNETKRKAIIREKPDRGFWNNVRLDTQWGMFVDCYPEDTKTAFTVVPART